MKHIWGHGKVDTALSCCWNCSLGVCGCQLNIDTLTSDPNLKHTGKQLPCHGLDRTTTLADPLCVWHCLLHLTSGYYWTLWDPHCKFVAPLQCLDVPEIFLFSLFPLSGQVLMLSSTADNAEEKSEERDLRQVLFCVALKCKWLLMCQDVQAGGKE